MTVRELIEMLENFDEDAKVVIGMKQTYGSNFAMETYDVDEWPVSAFYGDDYTAVVITEGRQIGTVEYEEY